MSFPFQVSSGAWEDSFRSARGRFLSWGLGIDHDREASPHREAAREVALRGLTPCLAGTSLSSSGKLWRTGFPQMAPLPHPATLPPL